MITIGLPHLGWWGPNYPHMIKISLFTFSDIGLPHLGWWSPNYITPTFKCHCLHSVIYDTILDSEAPITPTLRIYKTPTCEKILSFKRRETYPVYTTWFILWFKLIILIPPESIFEYCTFKAGYLSDRAGYCGPKKVLRYIAISKKVLQYIAIFINLIWKCFWHFWQLIPPKTSFCWL